LIAPYSDKGIPNYERNGETLVDEKK
jgi:hypothetical protein